MGIGHLPLLVVFVLVSDWQLRIPQLKATFATKGQPTVYGMALHPERPFIAFHTDNRECVIYDINSDERLWFWNYKQDVYSEAFSKNGKVALSEVTGGLQVRDLKTGVVEQTMAGGPIAAKVMFISEGTQLFAGGRDRANWHAGLIQRWDLATRKCVASVGTDERIWTLQPSPCGNVIVIGTEGGKLAILDAKTLATRSIQQAHRDRVASIAFSPDGRTMATGGGDGRIHLWNTGRWQFVRTLGSQLQPAGKLAFAAGGKALISSDGEHVNIWEVATGRRVSRFLAHRQGVLGLGYCVKAGLLATAGGDGTVKVWVVERIFGQIR